MVKIIQTNKILTRLFQFWLYCILNTPGLARRYAANDTDTRTLSNKWRILSEIILKHTFRQRLSTAKVINHRDSVFRTLYKRHCHCLDVKSMLCIREILKAPIKRDNLSFRLPTVIENSGNTARNSFMHNSTSKTLHTTKRGPTLSTIPAARKETIKVGEVSPRLRFFPLSLSNSRLLAPCKLTKRKSDIWTVYFESGASPFSLVSRKLKVGISVNKKI